MVKTVGLEEVIGEHPFFKEMREEDQKLIAGCGANVQFQAGEFLFRESEKAEKFYLLRHGDVALEINTPGREPLVVETMHEGDVVGWSWLFEPYRWTFSARAVGLVRAISLDAVCLRGKCETDHSLGYEIYKRFIPVMGERLRQARLRMIDMYAPSQTGTPLG